MADYKPVENMSNLYDKFYAKFAPSYKPQSASTLKDTLSRAMRPAYDKQITQRRDTGKVNRGEIVAGMGSSGMGTSTTMQDRLLRARDTEAKDIAGIESDYNAALYSALLNRLNAQDELSLTAENQARNTALGLAQSMYGQVYGAGGGGGGWGRRGRSTVDEVKDDDTYTPPIGGGSKLMSPGLNEVTSAYSMPTSYINSAVSKQDLKEQQVQDRTAKNVKKKK